MIKGTGTDGGGLDKGIGRNNFGTADMDFFRAWPTRAKGGEIMAFTPRLKIF